MKPFRTTLSVLVISAAATAAGFFGFNVLQNVQFAHAQEKVEATREQLASVEDLATVFRHVGGGGWLRLRRDEQSRRRRRDRDDDYTLGRPDD